MKQFGRGHDHLSALLHENDIVAYQTGSWYVDHVLVGDIAIPKQIQFCCVDTIQVVYTHNCEHGVIRGIGMIYHPISLTFQRQCMDQYIEFGPEQLIARIPVQWNHTNDDICQPYHPLENIQEWIIN